MMVTRGRVEVVSPRMSDEEDDTLERIEIPIRLLHRVADLQELSRRLALGQIARALPK
jgi:hypothetical protein